MLITSVLLIIKLHVSLFEIIYTLNPYPLYFVGVIFGIERLFYAITGSAKLFSFIAGSGEFSSFTTIAFFIFFISFGVYILAYSFTYTKPMIVMLNVLNGISFLLYSLGIFKAWHI